MSELIRYVELGDTTNLPRWLNVEHYEKYALGVQGNGATAKLYVAAQRPANVPGGAVFMVPPVAAQQTGFQPWAWWDALAKAIEVKPAP